MRTALAIVALFSAVSTGGALAACGATDAKVAPATASPDGGPTATPGDPPAPGDVPCDVAKILSEKCGRCHSALPEFGAPVPLVTMDDLHRASKSDPSRKEFELVAARVADDEKPMPPYPNARLAASDRAVLASWAAAGAPAGTGAGCTTKPPVVDPGVTCKPDLSIGPATPFTMEASAGDQYVCYGVELSRPTPTHVTAFAPRIDNTKIVHHVVLFEAEQAYSATPTPCSAGGSLQWRMVMGWAPGGKGLELPAEAGFPIKTDAAGKTHYVVQMHYSNPQALAGQVDTSGFDLCTAPPRKYEADVLAFGTQSIDMPAGAASYEKICSITVPQQLAGIHLFAVMPHMHKLGTSMKTELLAGGPAGASSDLGTVSAFSFDTQAWQAIQGAPGETGVVTKTNDVIKTRCSWKNTTGDRVKFGENTADEMCYSFTVYYPKIVAPIWSWATPSITSQCQ
ncbi:MAG TPA: peptidylglycine alpha-amidating monooxygenase [Labilithrix sp.]|nr:peptidylglycine alpha-amidating monooxygenase [Labilithrix sp.]